MRERQTTATATLPRHLSPDLHELEQIHVEAEVEPTAPSPTAEHNDTGIDSPLGIYFRDIARIPLLTAEQEVDLAQKLERGEIAKMRLRQDPPENGDELARLERDVEIGNGARTTLMESNLRLVVSVARRYLGRGLPFSDLIQEGSLGLSRAVEKFDYRRGFKFSTYAYWWIRQAVTRAIANQSRTIRVPVHMIDQIGHVYSKYQELQQKLGHDPKVEELAAGDGHDGREGARGVPCVRQSDLAGDPGRQRRGEHPRRSALEPAGGGPGRRGRADAALGLPRRCPGRADDPRAAWCCGCDSASPISARGRSARSAQVIGVSRERVRQLEAEAIAKLRKPNLRLRLAEYLE